MPADCGTQQGRRSRVPAGTCASGRCPCRPSASARLEHVHRGVHMCASQRAQEPAKGARKSTMRDPRGCTADLDLDS